MAQVVMSGDELIHILNANDLIPHQVTDIQADGEEIRVRVRTQWPVLKAVRVGVRFTGFENGHVVLQLVTNRFIDAFERLIDKMVESFGLDQRGGRWEYPRLYVDINRLIEPQLRGVRVESVAFCDGHFHIRTTHARGDNGTADSPGDDGAGTEA